MNDLVKSLTEKDSMCACIIEDVHSMPGQGVKSVWTFSENYAFWRALLSAHRIPFKQVTPSRWMKQIKTWPKDKKERKNALKSYSQNCFPELKVTLINADALAMLSVFDKIWSDI